MPCVLDALEAEWPQLAKSPNARRRLRCWSLSYPALADYTDLQDLLDGRRAGQDEAQAILLALARLAPSDDLASRTLLHAVIPGIVRLAATSGYDDPRALDELVAIAWERIRTYPTTRFGSVAANVLFDTRKRYRMHRAIEAPRSPEREASDLFPAPSAEDEAMGRLVLDELVSAQERGLVTRGGLSLVLRTRVADQSLRLIADEEQAEFLTVVMRRWRAEQQLRRLPLAG